MSTTEVVVLFSVVLGMFNLVIMGMLIDLMGRLPKRHVPFTFLYEGQEFVMPNATKVVVKK